MEESLKQILERLERIELILTKKSRPKPKTEVAAQEPLFQFRDPVANEFLRRCLVKRVQVELWLRTYGDADWIQQELLKMIGWMDCNKHKAPRANFTRFINSWLSRGWEFHRKNLLGNKPKEETDWKKVFTDDSDRVRNTNGETEGNVRGESLPARKVTVDL